ncbi:MAG: PEPxxWA-CTERM sorting domain-containing protein [Caulobacteraceae bacterium]
MGGNRMKLAILAGAAMLAAGSANAAAVVFNFDTPTGKLGDTQTYTESGLSIVASGFSKIETYNSSKGIWVTHPTPLYGKQDGGDENGLGLNNDPTTDGEIHYDKGFVQLDVSDLFGKVDPSSVDFYANSTTEGEEWEIFGSNTADSYAGSPILTGLNNEGTPNALPDWGTYTFYDFVEKSHPMGQGDNFLISEITAVPSAVPEPATWAMMLVGFFGLGGVLRSRRQALKTA